MRLDSVPHVEVNRQVENVVTELGPSTVYTVHPDVNMDHQAVFRSVMVATRPRTGSPVRRVLTYAPTSSVEWTPYFEASFKPTWFTDITQTLENKILAFDCFETETRPWPHPRSSRALRATAEVCGAGVGWPAAEPFALIRNLCC
jgi:LmbE family N-acetylglucosaminyl deacetylase